jgi:hypothetical protein
LLWHRRPQTSNELPDVVLGQEDFAQGTSNRGWSEPRADTLFWPYCVSWDGGHLWVADSGNRRVLMWDGLPQANGAPADLVLGQAEFRCRDENAGHHPDRASMRWPHAIAFPNGGLCIADAGNNRLMLWHRQPLCNFAGCDAVLGQADLRTVEHNRGRYSPDARSLNMPYGATVAGRWLAVADTANSRLLAWNLDRWPALDPDARALAAQANWSAKGDNRWQAPARDSVCWPYCVAVDGVHLLIADSGNNRILLWRLNAATH